jgi:transposase InsO family protein
MFAAIAHKKDSSVAFIVDSGAFKTQVPETMRHKLRNVKKIKAIPLDTVGNENPMCTEVGYMDFRLPGRSEVYTVECLVRTGRSHLCLFALDDFESLEPPVEEGTNFEQPVQVNFKRNFIKFGGKDIPLYRIDGMPCVVPEIVSGTSLASGASGATAAAAVHAGSEEQASWEFVHRILAHASPDYCERTVRKASGLPKSLAKSSRPCPECALGKMKAPRKGQGELSTGLPKPSGPGQQFSSDIFGPFSVPGLKGERYFITLSCVYSGWGAVRCMVSKDQAGKMLESMILEARAVGNLQGNADVHVLTLHSDNDSVLRSKEYTSRMLAARVNLHYSAPYEPRTNPYAERYGGTLLPMMRALLLEGSYPPKYWSMMVYLACWTNNRLVRPNGRAPIEVFAPHLENSLDFTHVHPTGVLAYWPVSKPNRDDSKLGSNGVGVYIGPAAMRGQTGHLVMTHKGHVLCVSHVRVDPAVKPYQRGLVNELSAMPGFVEDSTVDLAAHVLPDGVRAGDLIGAEIQQYFPGHGTFSGRVVDIHENVDRAGEVLFETIYSDGDGEIIPYSALQPLLVGPVSAAAAHASKEFGMHSGVSVPGYGFEERPMPAYAMLVDNDAEKTQVALDFLTCVSKRVWDPKLVPPGTQYSWNEIWRMLPEDRARHVAAMQAEIDKLVAAGHMEWAALPAGVVAIPGVGVFRLKQHDLHAQGELLKGRFCVNGKFAEEPLGGWETAAHVASTSQILAVIAVATDLGLKMKQIDVTSAFSQVKLPEGEEIYVKPLPGLGDPEGKGRVLKLLHHLYGHPLANAAWSKMWLDIVVKFGFKVVDRQGTVFSYRKGKQVMLMATIVDDSVVAFNDDALFDKFIAHVKREVPITVSDVEHICGMRVKYDMDKGVTTVDQTEYIEKKARVYGIGDSGYVYNTPMECNFKLGDRPDEVDLELVDEARSMCGSLIYATLTRPECKFPCSKMASVVANPTPDDINAMRRVLQYLYDTRNTCLTFRRGEWTGPDGSVHKPNQLVVYVDASFAPEAGDRYSQTGFVCMLNGATIYAKSGKQSQLADSTAYAETIALHEACHWVIGYRRILANMGFAQECATPMYEDNSAAEAFAKQGMGPKSLHFEVKYLYVHDQQKRGVLNVRKIDTKHQLADVLTKPVKWELAERLVSFLLGGDLVFSRGTRVSQ